MTYREPLSNQVLIFISAIGPGVLIGLIYDVIFSFFRAFGKKKAIIIAADLCFSVSATLISFFYMVIFNSGTVRFNMILAQLIGAVAFHFTLGNYLSKPVAFVADFIAKLIGFIVYPVAIVCKKSGEYIRKKREKATQHLKLKGKNVNAKKKIINILKIHLKK